MALFNIMDTLTFRVTAADIRNGTRASCGYCPLALAASRKLRSKCLVGYYHLEQTGGRNKGRRWWINESAKRFIHYFDCRLPVSAATFTLHRAT